MVYETCFDIQPVEHHDVVDDAEMLVLELVHIRIVEVDGVLMGSVNHIHYRRCTDTVAITKYHLGISVTLWVIRHTEWCRKVELVLLEGVTKRGVEC